MSKQHCHYEIPEFCMGEAIGEINRLGGILLKLAKVNNSVVIVEAEMAPEIHQEYDEWLAKLIAKGPQESYCSFCGKGKDEVKTMIHGPSVYICDECVGVCQRIIEEH